MEDCTRTSNSTNSVDSDWEAEREPRPQLQEMQRVYIPPLSGLAKRLHDLPKRSKTYGFICSGIIVILFAIICIPAISYLVQNLGRRESASSHDVAVVSTQSSPGNWTTALVNNEWVLVNPQGVPTILRGINLAGMDSGLRRSTAGAGAFLWFSAFTNVNALKDRDILTQMVYNVMQTLSQTWGANVVRVPICSSAWIQNYTLTNYRGEVVISYKDMLNLTIQAARASGMATIIDNQFWAVAVSECAANSKSAGCTLEDQTQCAPRNWYVSQEKNCSSTDGTNTPIMCWECPSALDDGVTIASGLLNIDSLESMWMQLATAYKDEGDVFFELWSEPFETNCAGGYVNETRYNWAGWSYWYDTMITAIREKVGATNVIIVSGMEYGYDFYGDGTARNGGPIVRPSLLTWAKHSNIAYSFHPYQGGACCGNIGVTSDESISDPYQAAFCLYYPGCATNGPVSNTYLPTINENGKRDTCSALGTGTYLKKMGPCTKVPSTVCGVNNCAGANQALCSTLGDSCPALNDSESSLRLVWSDPEQGGWSKYVLGMKQYGPLMATEFGAYDCSSPFYKMFLRFSDVFHISYTAWKIWPQDTSRYTSGACGAPSIILPSTDPKAYFKDCVTLTGCQKVMTALNWGAPLVKAHMLAKNTK